MPGFIVDQTATITCIHQGTCKALVVSPRVKLGGSPALLKTSEFVVAGCTLPPPPGANGPDVTGSWILGAVRVKSDGVPLLLADAQAICKPSGLGAIIQQTQVRAKAI
jgi:uncharacterized Zn-binding protein involved in type VI secretion